MTNNTGINTERRIDKAMQPEKIKNLDIINKIKRLKSTRNDFKEIKHKKNLDDLAKNLKPVGPAGEQLEFMSPEDLLLDS